MLMDAINIGDRNLIDIKIAT